MAWAEPMQTQDEMTELITQTNTQTITTLGGLFYNGQISMIEAYNQSFTAEEVMQTWVLFGDPTVDFRSKSLSAITATHPVSFSQQGGNLNITSSSVYGLVSITQNNQIIAVVNLSNGTASISIPNLTTNATLSITITEPNTIPYTGQITLNSLNTNTIDAAFSVYPNPTKNNITIINSLIETSEITATFMDLNGRTIASTKLTNSNSNTLSMDEFSSGLYLLVLESDTFTVVKKINKL
jgi:gingipain R